MGTCKRITFTSSFISVYLTSMKISHSFRNYCTSHVCAQFENMEFQSVSAPPALCSFSMHFWIIQSLFIVHHVMLCTNCQSDCVTRPGCCMDAEGLFMGEATLRKIFCLQETLRGVGGRPPLTESLLQADRVLFLPSPLLREKTAASQTPDKRVRCRVTPTLFQHPFTHTYPFSTSTHASNLSTQEQQMKPYTIFSSKDSPS